MFVTILQKASFLPCDHGPHLLADALHALHGGMPPLLVDVVQADVGDAVVAAGCVDGFRHGFGQFRVGDEIYGRIRIFRHQEIQQAA